MEQKTKLRWIKDIGCAAAMIMHGHDLVEMVQMENKPAGVMQFNFAMSDALMTDERAYWDKQMDGKLYEFYSNIRDLKGRIKNVML